MGISGGMLVANPVPREDEIPRAEMDTYIRCALDKAVDDGVSGKAVTPFLLAEILAMTDGRSLQTNIALVRSNALLAARIAAVLNEKGAG